MKRAFAAIVPLLIAAPAFAHPGHEAASGLATGVLHPLTGADHVLAMVAVGIWAAQVGGRAVWAMPGAFVLSMLAGGALGFAGAGWSMLAEPAILASVVILGVAAALALRLPLVAALGLLAIFGAAHGYAHGAEGPSAGLALYTAGFVFATAALHGAGLTVGSLLAQLRMRRETRMIGGLTAVALPVNEGRLS